jgi:hypothetical protein
MSQSKQTYLLRQLTVKWTVFNEPSTQIPGQLNKLFESTALGKDGSKS